MIVKSQIEVFLKEITSYLRDIVDSKILKLQISLILYLSQL